MNSHATRTAVIVGASSGIGEALAHELNRAGWRLGLLARRLERLEALRETLAPETVVRVLDVTQSDAAATLEHVLEELGGVDLVIISAGTGHNNRRPALGAGCRYGDGERSWLHGSGAGGDAPFSPARPRAPGRDLIGGSAPWQSCGGGVRGFEGLSVGLSRWPSRSGGAQRTPYRRHRSPAGLCRYSHDENGPPVTGGGQAAMGRFSCKGSQTDPSSGSETEEARVHYEAVCAGRFRLQASAASRLGKPAHLISSASAESVDHRVGVGEARGPPTVAPSELLQQPIR